MDNEISIAGLSKAKVLAALYNRARTQSMGFMHYTPKDMTEVEAQKLLDAGQTYFDYVHGRVMKVDLSKDILWTALYNRDNGQGAAERIVESLREKQTA